MECVRQGCGTRPAAPGTGGPAAIADVCVHAESKQLSTALPLGAGSTFGGLPGTARGGEVFPFSSPTTA